MTMTKTTVSIKDYSLPFRATNGCFLNLFVNTYLSILKTYFDKSNLELEIILESSKNESKVSFILSSSMIFSLLDLLIFNEEVNVFFKSLYKALVSFAF